MFNELQPKVKENLLMVASHFTESELQTKDDEISMDVPIMLLKNERIDICNFTNVFNYGAGK